MSLAPRTNPYFDWPEWQVRDEIAKLNVPPRILKTWPMSDKQRRTIKLQGLNQRLEEILRFQSEPCLPISSC